MWVFYMVKPMAGFSLIELMLVVLLLGLLITASASLTADWLDQNKLKQAQITMAQAAEHARSLAHRNAGGRSNTQVAAFLLLQNNQVCVVSGGYSTLDCTQPIWRSQLPVTTSSLNGLTSNCIGWNNIGVPVSAALAGTSCSVLTGYTLTSGNRSISDGYLE